MATVVEIANAIVSALNGRSWSMPFTATHSYLPRHSLGDFEEIKVTVVARSVRIEDASRGTAQLVYVYDIAFQKRVDEAETEDVLNLVEEVIVFLSSEALPGYPQAKVGDIQNDPPYLIEHLEDFRVLTSVVTVEYEVWR